MTNLKIVQKVVNAIWSLSILFGVGTIVLLATDKPAESVAVVAGMAGTTVGALATLLASTRSGSDLPPPPPRGDA